MYFQEYKEKLDRGFCLIQFEYFLSCPCYLPIHSINKCFSCALFASCSDCTSGKIKIKIKNLGHAQTPLRITLTFSISFHIFFTVLVQFTILFTLFSFHVHFNQPSLSVFHPSCFISHTLISTPREKSEQPRFTEYTESLFLPLIPPIS